MKILGPTALLLLILILVPVSLCCDSCLHKTKLVYHSEPPLPELINDGACGYDGSFATDLISSGQLSVATASAKIYKEGQGCGACYQIRCTDSEVCTKSGVKVVVTDFTEDNRTDFFLFSPTFKSLARPNKTDQLVEHFGAGLDVEYKRIQCEYPGKNMSIKVDKSSHYPDYIAVQFLYQGGQTDISGVEVARVGQWSWDGLRLRNYSAIWGIENPYLLKGQDGSGSLSFRLLVTGGVDGSWVWQPGCNLLPVNWKIGSVYDSGLQITERALEFDCKTCATGEWKDNI